MIRISIAFVCCCFLVMTASSARASPYQRSRRIMVFRVSVVFCRVERSSDVGRCCRYFRIGCWFLAVRGLQPGQCKQIVSGLKNGRAPERETRRRTESQVIFTFGKAVFMSGDLGGTKQRSMAIAERALFVILNIRGNIRSSATLSRGPRAGDAESPVVCPSWNCPGNRASLESKAGPSRSASQWAAGLRAPPLFSLSFCCSRPAALESETGVACLCLAWTWELGETRGGQRGNA